VSDLQSRLSAALHLAAPVELKLAEAAHGALEGYASVFGTAADSYGDVVAAGAFTKSLTRHKSDRTTPAMLWSHDTSEVIGRWTSVSEDAKGLLVKGQLDLNVRRAQEALSLLKTKSINGLSIGYITSPGGRVYEKDGTRTLREADVLEVSIVAIPAQRQARILDVKSVATITDFSRLLHEIGFSRSIATKLAGGGWPRLGGTPDAAELKSLADRIDRATGELQRLNSTKGN